MTKALSVLKSSSLSSVLQATDPNTAADIFVGILFNALQQSTTIRLAPCRQRISKPWITPGLLRCIRHRDGMHLKVRNQPNDIILAKSYYRYRNFCNHLLKKLKTEYERSEIQKASTNIKQTWKVIKRLANITQNKSQPDDLLKSDPDPQVAVNKVNSFFANVGKRLANKISSVTGNYNGSSNITPQAHSRSFVLLDTDEEEVERVILGLKNDSATGWDGISNVFLKISKDLIVPSLTHLINLCFRTGTFPKPFKISIIHPIHKSGPKDNVNNFRPISILPALSKIIEFFLNRRLMLFLEQEKLLSESQFGFRAKKSTDQAVSDLTNYIVSNLDSKNKCIGIFLDMAKAFDTVATPLLLKKLEQIGIRGIALKLFEDYLSNRTQRVSINNIVSDDENVTCGVPQGSILGPSLFLIFINDLCCYKPNHGKIFTFADDTALVFEGNTWEQVRYYAENGLRNVMSWLQLNLLTLNFDKSKFISFSISKRHRPPSQDTFRIQAHTCKNIPSNSCDCVNIDQVKSIKYLGVTIDEHLTWMPQIDAVSCRLRKLIWVFKNLRQITSLDLLKSVYFAICQSVLGYCISVWGGACKTKIIKLERAQRLILKVMLFKPSRYPTHLLFTDCNILTVRQLFILCLVLAQHKHSKFTKATSTLPDRSTSNKNVCITQRCYTTFAQRQQYSRGSHIYNKLNKILKFYDMTRHELKFTLKNWLLMQDYESTEQILIDIT